MSAETYDDADDVGAAIDKAVVDAYRLITAEAQGARPDVFGLSMSGLGGCRKQAAYRAAGTRPSDPDLIQGENRAANHGTAIHKVLLPALARVLPGGGRHEVPVLLADGSTTGIPGTLDLAWRDVIVDVKTVGEHKLDRALARGETFEHRMQVGGYALAHGARWVVWLYIDRATGQAGRIVEEFDAGFRAEVLQRVWEIQQLAESPDHAPRDEHGPGLSYACDDCPWLRRCWGRDARSGEPGAQSRIARRVAEVEHALGEYVAHRDEESRHKKWKAFWLQVATGGGRKPGPYGKWRFSRGDSSYGLDTKAVREDYANRGEVPPQKEQAPRVYVRRVK
ncbi:hypothetical protein AB0A05_26875 [Streptomyces sp. NPDC046374]|uniref:hypothetical protein n=1 Tax=Streptomyces sp. NPDC046374 TaxID=3154917 RepID=UPI0033CCF07B